MGVCPPERKALAGNERGALRTMREHTVEGVHRVQRGGPRAARRGREPTRTSAKAAQPKWSGYPFHLSPSCLGASTLKIASSIRSPQNPVTNLDTNPFSDSLVRQDSMKKILVSILLMFLLFGCQTETTGQAGIDYGMSKQQVIERLASTDKIISSDGDTVVSEGPFAPAKARARKEFHFHDGKLVDVTYKIL